ncbi:hypothetical protein [Nonomuraea recticatena]|uniref:Uncharacterized protein n=1 Tax=Nonomuraea recticatena TaxID=46178 RepID=A0ABN3T2T6_9ACTN
MTEPETEGEFLLLDQEPVEEEPARRRPWARCTMCGRRIWDPASLRLRAGGKCGKGWPSRTGHPVRLGRPRRQDVPGQIDMLGEAVYATASPVTLDAQGEGGAVLHEHDDHDQDEHHDPHRAWRAEGH